MQKLQLPLSTFAVEKKLFPDHMSMQGRNGSDNKRKFVMRMVETATAGIVALAAQILVVATILI